MSRTIIATALALALAAPAFAQKPDWITDSMQKLEAELIAKYGEAQRARLQRGLKQVADFWRPEDGDRAAFEELVRTHFAGDPATRDALFQRMQFILESVNGHMTEIARDLQWQSDLDIGPVYPFDELLAGYAPGAHITDDFFRNKPRFITTHKRSKELLETHVKAQVGCHR